MSVIGIDVISTNREAIMECKRQMELPGASVEDNDFMSAIIDHLCEVKE